MKKFLAPVLFILAVMILPLTFTGGIFGSGATPQLQNDSLTFGDTTALFKFNDPSNNFSLTIVDSSSSSYTDSVRVYLVTGGQATNRYYYSLLAVHAQSQATTTTNTSILIPGDGLSDTYNYHSDSPIYAVYVVRVNYLTAGYTAKTKLAIVSN